MNTVSILLTGVGGQGTILTSKILAVGLAGKGLEVKMSEIHGMSQRGGTVNTQIKFGDSVSAPNIGPGEADVIVAFEKVEALRALPYLKKGGLIVTDEKEIFSMPVLTGAAEYPHNAIDELKKTVGDENVRLVPAAAIAEELGNPRCQNIVLFGALVRCLALEDVDWESIIRETVPKKAVDVNLAAYRRGLAL